MRSGLRRHISSWMLAMFPLAAPAFSEPAPGAPVEGSRRAIPLQRLEGVNIHAKLVTEMLAQQSDGPQGPSTLEDDWNVTVDPGGKIRWSYQSTARSRRGTQTGVKIANTSALDQALHTANGDAMWQSSDGELTFLRSYQGGAIRVVIAFREDGPNLTCDASNVFARERDKKDLTINSPVDGTPVTIFSWKQISSNCNVQSPLTGFDGFWLTRVICDKQGDVSGWSQTFIGRVKDGAYHGQVGEEGKPGWNTYDGTIERDGSVELIFKGLTNVSGATLGHLPPGTKISPTPFAGRFEESRGTALRVVGRTCHMDFVKQDFVKQ
jgi:hypothetical protein